MNRTAILFDIKEFAVHDGPGIRTTVFFKGCPLRCLWCHNPEGLSPKPELMTKEARCRHCGKCREGCTHEACRPFGRCLYACPDALITVCGKEYTTEALSERLLRSASILRDSGGGVTFSGGEPLMQADFLLEMLEILTREGIHTAVETSGYAPRDVFSAVARSASMVYMDLKLADQAVVRAGEAAVRRRILENAAYLRASGTEHCFRTPLIPHITDTEENLAALAAVVGSSPWEKLPYNTLAGAKYPMLGRVYPYDEWRGEPS